MHFRISKSAHPKRKMRLWPSAHTRKQRGTLMKFSGKVSGAFPSRVLPRKCLLGSLLLPFGRKEADSFNPPLSSLIRFGRLSVLTSRRPPTPPVPDCAAPTTEVLRFQSCFSQGCIAYDLPLSSKTVSRDSPCSQHTPSLAFRHPSSTCRKLMRGVCALILR